MYIAESLLLRRTEIHQLVRIIKRVVGIATTHGTLDIYIREFLEYLISREVLAHFAFVHREDRTKFDEGSKMLFLFFLSKFHLLLTFFGLCIDCHLGCFSYRRKGTVWRKVEHIAVRLLSAFEYGMSLHPEDGLHVVGSRSILRAFHTEHGSPFRNTYTRGKLTTREGDGMILLGDVFLGIATDVVQHISQSTTILIFDITITCSIDDMEHSVFFAKYIMLTQKLFESSRFFHTRQEPEGVAEVLTEYICRERVEAGVGIFNKFIEEAIDCLLVYELVYFHLSQFCLIFSLLDGIRFIVYQLLKLSSVFFSVYSEEFMKFENLIILDGLVAQHLRQRKGKNLHTWQVSVWVRVAIMMLIPELLGTLFHHVVPSINFTFLIFVEQVERCSRK